ncbi:MAG: pseudouridine synthase [Gammaproteobacteria bacterium]|nr:pseudouridine synthase [Gammaproteobacteria bacterium]
MPERLQKWLAAAGVGSRREIEGWIAAGRVEVNGRRATLGQKVSGSERIVIDGRVVRVASRRRRPPPRVIVYHKPVGEICTRRDPEGRPSVFDALPRLTASRWVIVGRLDIDTSGLLLFTTDGQLAHALMHPSGDLEREYAVRVRGNPDETTLRLLRDGVVLDDGPGRFATIHAEGGDGANRWFRVTVTEGRNRLVRRLWEAVGCQVSRLMRVRFGPLTLPRHLPRGRHRDLGPAEVEALYSAAGLDIPVLPLVKKDKSKQKSGKYSSARSH